MPGAKNISDDVIAMDYLRSLRACREKHGLTLPQLGKIIGRSHTAVYTYEIGKYIPEINVYNILADFFKWPRYCPQRSISNTTASNDTQNDSLTLPLGLDADNETQTQQDDKKRRAYSIPENLLNDIRDIATIKGCSMSEIITSVLEEYTAKHKGSLLAIRAIRNS